MSHAATLAMPQPGNSGSQSTIATPEGSVVIIGANGSGKTRLGAWFEITSEQQGLVRRIGAQKSLAFPASVSPTSLQDAIGALDIGVDATQYARSRDGYSQNPISYRKGNKWQGKPETALVDDYKALLILLVSEQYEVSLDYTLQAKNQTVYTTPPSTKLDQVKRIWEQVLPHRELVLKASTVQVKPTGASAKLYEASDMSDGERVSFYLIGQCLAAPTDAILVIDEPEIHLHHVIQARLWDAAELARPDCLFVYLTHDLDFAASRTDAKKLWIKSFDGQNWDWEVVPDPGKMPEALLLAVLGSRKPVLFTEGEAGGYEQAIFSRIYPGWTIMPCGNCEQVIDATQSFTNLKHLHGNECRGIIDRDYRDEHNVARLQAQGVLVLETQEIENLMLDEAVLTAVLEQAISSGAMAGTVSEKLAAIKAHLFGQLARDQELLTTKRASWEIEKGLRQFGTAEGALGQQALEQAVAATCALPVADIYQRIDQEFTRIIAAQDYSALLRLYNNKGLAKRIGQFFNFREPFPDYFKRLLSIQGNEALVQALRVACPILPTVATSVPLT